MKFGNDPLGLSFGDVLKHRTDPVSIVVLHYNYADDSYGAVATWGTPFYIPTANLSRSYTLQPKQEVVQDNSFTEEAFLKYLEEHADCGVQNQVKGVIHCFKSYLMTIKEEKLKATIKELESLGYTVTKNNP